MSDTPDPGLGPRSNRALVLGLVGGLVGAAALGTWFVVHEGGRVRGAATSGDSTAAPLVRGEQVYGLCANCHGRGGGGQLGRAPALLGSPWLDPEPLTRLVLHGFSGPDPSLFREKMVGAPALSDRDVAALVSFVGHRFAGRDDVVPADVVGRIRAATAGRTRAWTVPELRALVGEDGS